MSSPYSSLILILLMGAAFYVLLVRPQRRRQLAQQQTLRTITPGTRVLLGGGIFATVVRMGDKQAVLEVSPGVQVTVMKQAIIRAVGPEEEDNPYVGGVGTGPLSDHIQTAEAAGPRDLASEVEPNPRPDEPLAPPEKS
jgi:preprotein translocase subunit YajC